MTKLIQLKSVLATNLLSTQDQISLKGKGMGNMVGDSSKNCPPPVDDGKIEIKEKFL